MQTLIEMHGVSNTSRSTEDRALVQNAIEVVVRDLEIDGIIVEKT